MRTLLFVSSMRSWILFSLLFLLGALRASAGENDWYVGTSGGAFFNPSSRTIRYGAALSLEKQLSGRNFIEVTLLGTVHPNRDLLKESELVLQGYYKPLLSLGKNSYGLLKVGPNVGFGSIGVLFGAGVGFEYGVVFKSGLKFFIAQDNLLVFRGDDRFSSGVSAGIRIPL